MFFQILFLFLFSDNGASIVVLSSIQSGHNWYTGAGKQCDPFEGVYRDEETSIFAPGKKKSKICIIILTLNNWASQTETGLVSTEG